MQDERLLTLGLDEAGEVGLLDRRVDVRIAVVLEDPEVPIEPYVEARRLDHLRVVRLELDPPGLEFRANVPVREQHAGTLPAPG